MTRSSVIEAVKDDDTERLQEALTAAGVDVDERDEQGWTALNWAAGRGDADAVRALLDHGADITLTGRDNRTPLRIAKAAGHEEVVAILSEAEKAKGAWQDPQQSRPYCRAYYLKDLRAFPGLSLDAGGDDLADDAIVYLHQDFTVTRSMWHGEDVLVNEADAEWTSFCRDQLDFAIPADLL